MIGKSSSQQQVKFWGCQKIYADFQLGLGLFEGIQNPVFPLQWVQGCCFAQLSWLQGCWFLRLVEVMREGWELGQVKWQKSCCSYQRSLAFFWINALQIVLSLWLISRVSNRLIWANSEEQIYGGCHLTILELLTSGLVLFENNSLIVSTVSQEGNESR